MKRLLLSLLAALALPNVVNAEDTCNFISEFYPDVTIEVKNQNITSTASGKLKYKNK